MTYRTEAREVTLVDRSHSRIERKAETLWVNAIKLKHYSLT
ncbi:hypothetical protein [Halobacillus mangrovi]